MGSARIIRRVSDFGCNINYGTNLNEQTAKLSSSQLLHLLFVCFFKCRINSISAVLMRTSMLNS